MNLKIGDRVKNISSVANKNLYATVVGFHRFVKDIVFVKYDDDTYGSGKEWLYEKPNPNPNPNPNHYRYFLVDSHLTDFQTCSCSCFCSCYCNCNCKK